MVIRSVLVTEIATPDGMKALGLLAIDSFGETLRAWEWQGMLHHVLTDRHFTDYDAEES